MIQVFSEMQPKFKLQYSKSANIYYEKHNFHKIKLEGAYKIIKTVPLPMYAVYS